VVVVLILLVVVAVVVLVAVAVVTVVVTMLLMYSLVIVTARHTGSTVSKHGHGCDKGVVLYRFNWIHKLSIF